MLEGNAPILLGGYAAKRCPVRTHNDFAPLIPTLKWEPTPEVQADLDAGNEFEREIFRKLLAIHDRAILVDADMRKEEAIAETTAAMKTGAPLVLGGWLPDDLGGGRTGRPDILVRFSGGYLPADVKHHKTVQAAKTVSKTVSNLAAPNALLDVEGLTSSQHYYEDGLQLAHYTRMLQACGFHPGEGQLLGAILGTSQLSLAGSDPEFIFAWHDLARPTRFTFSRSRGKVRRSLLESYDHEHGFRVKVAENAVRIVGNADDPEPLVVPIGQSECADCPYEFWCAERMGPDDPSAAITRGRLDTREWRTLRSMGITTTGALADLDPEDEEFFGGYHAEVAHYSAAEAQRRLIAAIRQARMIRDGIEIEPLGEGPIEVPAADVEIDFDIEWDVSGRIYQWGLRIREDQDESTARYEPVVSFDLLDDASEAALAEEVAVRIIQLRSEAEQAGKTVAVYHWHHVEVSKTSKFESMATALDGVAVDLLSWFKRNLVVRKEASIKTVAALFGYSWAVDDPGGRLSQNKIEIARGAGLEARDARQWCLSYNESDVEAQAVIRDGVRATFCG